MLRNEPAPMMLSAQRTTRRRAACLAFAATTMLATVHGASADDGVTGFLSSIFGGEAPQPRAHSLGEEMAGKIALVVTGSLITLDALGDACQPADGAVSDSLRPAVLP